LKDQRDRVEKRRQTDVLREISNENDNRRLYTLENYVNKRKTASLDAQSGV